MRRIFAHFLAAIALLNAPALAQTIPPLIAAPTENDLYALSEAPDDHIIGSDTAPNTLIIYASVTCPHCAHWFTQEWDLLKSELIDTDELRVVFREFITQPANIAAAGFTLANCTKADNYIEVIHHQMVNQSTIQDALEDKKGLEAYSSTLELAGLTQDDVESCFSNASHRERLHTSMARARASGLKGVPAFVLNGELHKGSITTDKLSELFKGGVSKP